MNKVITALLLSTVVISAQAQDNVERTYDNKTSRSKASLDALVAGELAGDDILKGDAFKEKLLKATKVEKYTVPASKKVAIDSMFEYAKDRTYMLVTPYNCGHCADWHRRGATAWALSEDGIMMTNYHCFNHVIEKGVAVSNYDLDFYPVIDILVADKEADLVVFQVKLPEGVKLKTYPIGKPEAVGSDLHLVSHTLSQPYYYSKGYLSGYADTQLDRKSEVRLWMRTELGYGFGSSGGGIINNEGEVVGMVSYIKPQLKYMNDVKKTGDYAAKIFEYTVPVSAMRARLIIEGE